MNTQSIMILLLFGLAFWLVGTLWYRLRGALIFETTSLRYWANFIVTPTITTLVCLTIFRWWQIPTGQWSSAGLLIAIPGMVGEVVLLSRFTGWMPNMQPASAGRYGAFLFATYAFVLGIAEIATLRAA